MFSSENFPEHLCLSVTQAEREIDSHASSYTNRHTQRETRARMLHAAPAVASVQRPGKGALWALGTTTAPPSAPFVGSQDWEPVCPAAPASHTAQLSIHKGSSLPHRSWVSLFYERSLLQLLCALSAASSTAHARGAGIRVKIDSQARCWRDHREESAPLGSAWPPTALSRESFASSAVPECFLGSEMSNISALLWKDNKVCKHRILFNDSGEINYTSAYTLQAYMSGAYSHTCAHTSIHTNKTTLIAFFSSLGNALPFSIGTDNILLETHHTIGQSLQRKGALSPNHLTFPPNVTDFKFHLISCWKEPCWVQPRTEGWTQ